jgi:hypothetical protein
MKNVFSRIVVASAIAFTAGCATTPPSGKLTYETAPGGATLYEGGQSIGIAPVMRSYAADAAGGQIRTPEVTAVWPSGAKTVFWTFLKPGDDNVTTLSRPAKAPNLEVDAENAKKYASEEERRKAGVLRDLARNSARCQAQTQSGGSTGIDNCSSN